MYISFSELLLTLVGITLLCLWASKRLKAQITQEKLTSFSFALGAIIEGALILDMNARINWMAKRLESVRGNITKDVFSNLIRAACLLYGIRRFIDKQEGNSPVTPLDVGGEYLRFLGLQVAGANQPFAKELAKIAISTCENFPDILPSDDFWGVLMNDERFGKSGQALFTSQDLHAAQLMIERTISDHYRDSTRVKLFKIP